MGSRLFDEIREKRGLCYSVSAHAYCLARHGRAAALLGAGVEQCVEAYERMRGIVDELRVDGPRPDEVERARAYAAGSRVLAFENSRAVATHAARQRVVFDESGDPDAAIADLDGVTFDEVREIAADISVELAVACVGPHAAGDF